MTKQTLNRTGLHRRGYTLIELLVGLAVMVLILTAATAFGFAALKSWSNADALRDAMLQNRAAISDAERVIRSARAIGYTTNNSLLIWANDNDGDNRINLGELVYLHYEPAQNSWFRTQLLFGPNVSQQTRQAHCTAISWSQFTSGSAVQNLLNDQYCRDLLLSDNISNYNCNLDAPAPQTTTVYFKLTITVRGRSQSIYGGAKLRIGPIQAEQ